MGGLPRSVGLTGNIGSGKSTAARLLGKRGAVVIDSDDLARQATADPAVLQQIAQSLGEDLVTPDGLDRAATARLIFSNPEAKTKLEGIIHPWVRARSRKIQHELLDSPEGPELIVHDIPLLFENDLASSFDVVVVVDAPLEVRMVRASARDGLSEAEVRERDAAQLPLEEKVHRADYVLDNSGDEARLQVQVDDLWRELVGS